jgi:hypothetical protein
MDENINLPEDKLNTHIFRIISFDRIIEILESQKNTLTRPERWDDPFETLINFVNVEDNLDYPVKSFGSYIYAQCWTFSEENDLLWRVYSPERDGVRIRSTPSKLLNSLNKSSTIVKIKEHPEILEQWPVGEEKDYVETPEGDLVPVFDDSITISQVIQPFIGQVEYLTINQIRNYLAGIRKDSHFYELIRSILIKREPFKNEEEVRFGVFNFNTLEPSLLSFDSGRFNYDFDINETFDELVFDPRISRTKFDGLKDLIKKLGYKNPVLRSSIYDKPDILDFDNDDPFCDDDNLFLGF